MCGRYTLTADQEALAVALQVPLLVDHRPRYNIAPTQTAPVLVASDDGPVVRELRWGLVPRWARDPSIGNRMINARAETVHEKPAFRHAFRRGRCLVPADGFYEWRKQPSGKTPFWIHREGGKLFTFAGIRERWTSPEGEELATYAILTTDAPPELRTIHPRVPVVVDAGDRSAWLDPESPPEAVRPLLRSPPSGRFAARRVSSRVNSPRNDDPDLVEPVPGDEDPEPDLFGSEPPR